MDEHENSASTAIRMVRNLYVFTSVCAWGKPFISFKVNLFSHYFVRPVLIGILYIKFYIIFADMTGSL
jgi:hypothetical protein